MKFEVILRVKRDEYSLLEQIGKIIVSPDYLKAQIERYEALASKMKVWRHWVLVNQLSDDGEFEQVIV